MAFVHDFVGDTSFCSWQNGDALDLLDARTASTPTGKLEDCFVYTLGSLNCQFAQLAVPVVVDVHVL